jgi:Zn-dependent protease
MECDGVDLLAHIDIAAVLIQFAVLLFSLSIHEASHAWAADRLGDGTARYLGRVTLNPIRHIDPVGTIVFPLLQFFTNLPLIGWAKPVPVNPSHLRRPRRDQALISLAGPGANLLAGIAAFLLLGVIKHASPFANGMLINMVETNAIPHHPSVMAPLVGMLYFAMIINLALAVFNLIPIPPLDGHWMLYGVLPYNAGRMVERMAPYGFILLYALMFLGIFQLIYIPIGLARKALLNL